MKILILSNKSPYPASEGGPIAMNAIISGLAKAGHILKVLAISSPKHTTDTSAIPAEYLAMTGIEFVEVDLSVKPADALWNLMRNRSYHVERFISKEFSLKLSGILREQPFDVIQLETLYMCPYIGMIRRLTGAAVVLRAHNIEHRIWERLANDEPHLLKRIYLKQLAATLKRFEISAASSVDGIAAISNADADWFRSHAGSFPLVETIDFGMDFPEEQPADESNFDNPGLYHIGSMNWMPNEEGIRWFLRDIWPMVVRALPSLKLTLAGRHMPDWIIELQLPNLIVAGEVVDAPEFVRSQGILVVPLLSGSGVRIKILEAMWAGKPVISTSIGAEGIPYTHGENILIADSPQEWLKCISMLVSDQSLARKIGMNGAILVRRHHNNQAITANLVTFYNKLIAKTGQKGAFLR